MMSKEDFKTATIKFMSFEAYEIAKKEMYDRINKD